MQAAPAELCVWAAGGLKPPTKRKFELDVDSCEVDLHQALGEKDTGTEPAAPAAVAASPTPAPATPFAPVQRVPCGACSSPLPDAQPRFCWETMELDDILEADAAGLFPDATCIAAIAAIGFDEAALPPSLARFGLEAFWGKYGFFYFPEFGKILFFIFPTDKM